jgi:preprotein translocase subunit SecA
LVYTAGDLLKDLDREELKELIWNHYMNAEDGLRQIFGKLDWGRLRSYNIPLSQLKPETQEKISRAIGSEIFEEVKEIPPAEMDGEIAAEIQSYLGKRIQNEVNRQVILRSITGQWVDYLTQIEGLRVSISMESYAQRNPLVVYKTKAAELFSQLLNDIRRSVVEQMFVTLPQLSMLTAAERISLADLRQQEPSPQESNAEPVESDSGRSDDGQISPDETAQKEEPREREVVQASSPSKKKKKKMKK